MILVTVAAEASGFIPFGWLVDRLTGSVYRCQAEGRGRAACEPDIATGSVSDRPNDRPKPPKDGR